MMTKPSNPPQVAPTFTPIPTYTAEAQTGEGTISLGLTLQSSPLEEAGSDPPYTIKAQIPFLQGSDDPRVQNFNTLLKQIVQKEIDGFKADILAFASNPPIAGGSFFESRFSIIGQRGDVWSLKFDNTFYSDGAAHPGHYSLTVNYDLANGREIALDELFLPGSSYLQIVSDYCKAELSKRDIAFDSFSGGADPLPENYQRWNVSNDGLVVTFDEYQVAPYAAGPQVVTVPFFALQEFIQPGGVLSPFAQ